MSNTPLEAAAKHGTIRIHRDDMKGKLVALVRAAVGCQQCEGEGRWRPWEHGVGHSCDEGFDRGERDCIEGDHRCPADHAVIVVWGETIHADKDKCHYLCLYWNEVTNWQHPYCVDGDPGPAARENHDGCGWVPRWDVLSAE